VQQIIVIPKAIVLPKANIPSISALYRSKYFPGKTGLINLEEKIWIYTYKCTKCTSTG